MLNETKSAQDRKHIVIDARLYGPRHTGNGRYTKNLLMALDKLIPQYPDLKFTAIVYTDLLDSIRHDLKNFTLVPTDIRIYSFSEQFILPFLIKNLKPDLLHVSHFNKSILYFGRTLVTVHDLIMNFFKGSDTTTRNPLFYWPKYAAYRILIFLVIKSSRLIVPSNFWRDYIIKNYSINPKDIITTHEAVDPKFLNNSKIENSKIENYILYTGNLYPHKNLKIVLEALKFLPDIKLKIISARSDAFIKRVQKLIGESGLQNQVELLGFVPDEKFKEIYSQALALVHPSYMEGFSLTGLEAMALNCPVIASNTSCMPEIYGDSVLYFNPDDSAQLVKQINTLHNNPLLRKEMIAKGHSQVAKYSWDKTAQATLDFYLKILKC